MWWGDQSTVPVASENLCFWPVNESESGWIFRGLPPPTPHFLGPSPPTPLHHCARPKKHYVGLHNTKAWKGWEILGWLGCNGQHGGWEHHWKFQSLSLSFTGDKHQTSDQHVALVNSSHLNCSSMAMSAWNLTKLQDLMSNTLHHTFQP